MNEDGSGKKRITNTEGYDGGAVFSHDGSKMVWRAYHPDTPEKMAKYRELLKENLTDADEDGVVRRQCRRLQRQADHEFRLRQFRADLHARQQEDPVRLE